MEYARRHAVPLLVINTNTFALSEELGVHEAWLHELRQEWRRVDAYNWARVVPDRFRDAVHHNEQAVTDTALAAGLAPQSAREMAYWLSPYLARSSQLAQRCRALYMRLTAAVFFISALAVITVATQVLFVPDVPELAFVELVLLGTLLSIVGFGRWSKINRRFICDRFLAERLRETPFLVLAGLDRSRSAGFKRGYLGRRPEGWPWRAFADVWNRRPRDAVLAVTDAITLQRTVTERWIDGQIRYLERAAAKNRRLHVVVFWGNVALLSGTIVAAALHASGVGGHETHGLNWANALVLVSIAVPAVGAALSGIGAQREYARHAERSERMIEYLLEARADVAAAYGLDAVRDATRETAELLLAENRDWFGVLSFRDLEPHS